MLKQGLYEQVVNKEIKEELNGLSDAEKHIEKIDSAEAASVLTQYLSEVVRKGLDRIAGDDISAQLELANKIVGLISLTNLQKFILQFIFHFTKFNLCRTAFLSSVRLNLHHFI